jgi:hypothetical protein
VVRSPNYSWMVAQLFVNFGKEVAQLFVDNFKK